MTLPTHTPSRILVIDDDEQMQAFMHTTLRRAGHTVLAVPEARHILDLLQQNPFDIIIIDLIMPDTDGLEAIINVRRLHPALKIVAVSGGPDANLKAARQLGAGAILTKPFSQQELLDEIARIAPQPDLLPEAPP